MNATQTIRQARQQWATRLIAHHRRAAIDHAYAERQAGLARTGRSLYPAAYEALVAARLKTHHALTKLEDQLMEALTS